MNKRIENLFWASVTVASSLLPSCAGPVTQQGSTPARGPIVTIPTSELIPTPQLTSTPKEIEWPLGEMEYKCSINIPSTDGRIYPMEFYFPQGSGRPVTEQTLKVINFFLTRKTEPFPENIKNFQVFFTYTEPPPEETFYARTVSEKGVAAISLSRIRNKPLSNVPGIEIDDQTAVNVVTISEWCNLLWDPGFAESFDLSPELQGVGQGHFCDSVGAMFAAAMRGLTYEKYLEELEHWFFLGDPRGSLPLVVFPEQIFNEAAMTVAGGPPIRVDEIAP